MVETVILIWTVLPCCGVNKLLHRFLIVSSSLGMFLVSLMSGIVGSGLLILACLDFVMVLVSLVYKVCMFTVVCSFKLKNVTSIGKSFSLVGVDLWVFVFLGFGCMGYCCPLGAVIIVGFLCEGGGVLHKGFVYVMGGF